LCSVGARRQIRLRRRIAGRMGEAGFERFGRTEIAL
jgi:hypothetical protein